MKTETTPDGQSVYLIEMDEIFNPELKDQNIIVDAQSLSVIDFLACERLEEISKNYVMITSKKTADYLTRIARNCPAGTQFILRKNLESALNYFDCLDLD